MIEERRDEFEPAGPRMPGAMYLRARERHEREQAPAGVAGPAVLSPDVVPLPRDTASSLPDTTPPRPVRHARGRSPRARQRRAIAGATAAVTVAMLAGWTLAGRVAQPDTGRQPVAAAPAPTTSSLTRLAAPLPAAVPGPVSASVAPGAPTTAAASAASAASAAAAPARTATVANGPQLAVTTTPAGAHVTVRDIGWGTTPLTVRHLPGGVARVRVTLDGYASVERQVVLREDGAGTVRLHVPLVPLRTAAR